MSKGIHDTLVYRLSQMLVKLNQGEKLSPNNLADEFGVNVRTIQRDLNVRFAYLPLQKEGGFYSLDPLYLGKLSTRDIERFAGLAGVQKLFPSLTDDFLRDIFDSSTQSALLVKGYNYENLTGKETLFRELEKSIQNKRRVNFSYKKEGVIKQYQSIEPYKLVNNKGIWYLACRDSGKLKTFSFSKIITMMQLDDNFEADSSIDKLLSEDDSVWIGEETQEVVLKVSKKVADYFRRRKLIVNQEVEKELEDGSLIISTKVANHNQIIPIIRYWIPHIRIISPDGLQEEMEQELIEYLSSA
ncbi:MAG: transcriptional regulator [endosymbiont of Galathealinum brachiosum]|uniref:Transcriptional regulator n=1 Tax=endosymbiont of Galathealinum brachiosum TaxID=2200906 RepID=A0A370DC46_9GAMM|nr:MAG: transcriptional regulator [endosymbiont of Galathealinum brachiosum]